MVLLPLVYSALIFSSRAVEITAKQPMRDSPTEEELNLKLKEVQQHSPGSTYVAPPADAKGSEGTSQDLWSSSEILCFGDAMTLIPKHAVIHTPKSLAARLKKVSGAQLITWDDFFPANRSWITTVEVSLEQAEGKMPLSAKTSELMIKSGKVVVATFNGNPISLLTTKASATPTTSVPTKPISRP